MTRGDSLKRAAVWLLGGLVTLLLTAACSQGASAQVASAKESEIASLKTRLEGLQQDATYWQQLTAVLDPVTLPSMTDHRAYMLPTGVILALHFDNMKLDQAKSLNWVALGIPGRFCKGDQERIEGQFGKGFTHFHNLKNDTHGGIAGAEGVWFVHVGVREFTAPWGPVKPGVDEKFMPTAAPSCP